MLSEQGKINEKQLLQVEHLSSKGKLQNTSIINIFMQLLQNLYDLCFLKKLVRTTDRISQR